MCFLPCPPDVFIRRCRGAKLQINKAISTSQPLTLTREDLLVVTATEAHRDLITSLWLAGYRATQVHGFDTITGCRHAI